MRCQAMHVRQSLETVGRSRFRLEQHFFAGSVGLRRPANDCLMLYYPVATVACSSSFSSQHQCGFRAHRSCRFPSSFFRRSREN